MLLCSRYPSAPRPILARLGCALLALAGTLLLGTIESRWSPSWRWFESPEMLPMIGLVFASAAGLLACHLASLTNNRSTAWAAALPAALLAGALPGLGSAALLVPLALSAHAALRLPALRPAALAGLAGTTIALIAAGLHHPALHGAGALTLLAAAAVEIGRSGRAANDNRRDEPFTLFGGRPAHPPRAMPPARTSSPVLRE
ncbi:hypothetical protein E5A73_17355 [Sphingomonas gei]|uniref:Uncharacterized protein n=1 Tax=Sphingomonas gei TaxID=1395960 RepID=A0A4S1X2N2_9SPHN|nr:hypothetical protein [Sphingomonas gei]TGX50189.1 hypothetical protein E5A73_17355 [Sphingomonas gei]